MRLWKQLIFSFVIIVAGMVAILSFVPGAATLAGQLGVPKFLLGSVTQKDGNGPKNPGRGSGGGGFGGPTLVVTKPVTLGKVNDRLSAIGDGDALRSVNATSSVNGTLVEVLVKSGDRLKAGDVIARLDDDSETLALEKATVALKSAEQTLARNIGLKSIVSKADLAKAETEAQTAQLQRDEAALALKRRTITAPINGVAGIVSANNGDYITTANPIVTIDDRSQLLIDFWVPERFSPLVSVGAQVTARALARPGEVYQGALSAIDSRIDQASRTLRLQATIPNDDDHLRAGMSFSVSMSFPGEAYPAVDPLAIQWGSGGAFVWRITKGSAERVNVHIVERNSDSVLVEAALKPGDAIVTQGVQRVRSGAKVMVAKETTP